MLSGHRLHDDLSSIILRWRKHRIVFTTDVERMYRQIVVDEPDANYQRIVWRASPSEPMNIYQLTTVTYGTTSAPYLAVKSLQVLAELERERFPMASKIAQQDFYVDDVLTGFDDIATALHGQDQLGKLMSAGGFELKKWTSNHSELPDHLPIGYCECRLPLELNLDQQIKTLGVRWNPVNDTFAFKIALNADHESSTKRKFLSDAASLYDPLGWLAPSIVLIKINFQQLWLIKLDWDDELPTSLTKEWYELRQSFLQLQHLQIDRWIGTSPNASIELYGFCDASVKAYAAVVFIRVTTPYGCTSVKLLCAKTKIAPLKIVSLPRLELCGAVLLCRLMKSVEESMQFESALSYCWTDSTIVLAWIKGAPVRWSVFVANRAAEIQRHFPIIKWRHVVSEDNPADCAFRGIPPTQLPTHNLWWTGPRWLQQPSDRWPMQSLITETLEEVR